MNFKEKSILEFSCINSDLTKIFTIAKGKTPLNQKKF